MKFQQSKKRLGKKAKKGFRGYPIATIALYGPDDKTALKVVASIIANEDADPDPQQKWFSNAEVRNDEGILGKILAFLEEYKAISVIMPNRIIGCPHEEIIDYPEGEECPECLFWKGRDRWTGQRIH